MKYSFIISFIIQAGWQLRWYYDNLLSSIDLITTILYNIHSQFRLYLCVGLIIPKCLNSFQHFVCFLIDRLDKNTDKKPIKQVYVSSEISLLPRQNGNNVDLSITWYLTYPDKDWSYYLPPFAPSPSFLPSAVTLISSPQVTSTSTFNDGSGVRANLVNTLAGSPSTFS